MADMTYKKLQDTLRLFRCVVCNGQGKTSISRIIITCVSCNNSGIHIRGFPSTDLTSELISDLLNGK